jgi:hypothetical protein
MGNKVAIRMILQGTFVSNQVMPWTLYSCWTYLSCSLGLLKRNECLIIAIRITRQVVAVQAPDRIMLNLWKVKSPMKFSDASRIPRLA